MKALDLHRRIHLIWLSEKTIVWRMTHAPTRKECADHSCRAALSLIGSRWYTRHAVSRMSCSMSREVIYRTRGGLPLNVSSRYKPRGVVKSAVPRKRAKRWMMRSIAETKHMPVSLSWRENNFSLPFSPFFCVRNFIQHFVNDKGLANKASVEERRAPFAHSNRTSPKHRALASRCMSRR
jgi:hypothetical protein